ncbi:coiled-coil-helix-coiled-coil-helix domain-containing protein 2-like [Diadema antillarum]|uniref:coiled-coil-helix-coiled-coil-helix domain-containing protein 2-like n=1 Tax=Diadema antillarum TaxID=105358 RepID=UPI003A89104F
MPRGGRSRGRSFSPVRSAPPRTVAQPAPVPQRAPVPAQQPAMGVGQPRQPGLLGQMAATAGGVAIGSAVGHAVGHAMTGGGGHHQPDVTYQEQPQQQQQRNPCQYELERFMQCADTQSDLSLCDAFNIVLKDCKRANGLA